MTPAKKAFRWVFLVCLGFGLLIGTIKIVAPDAAHVTLNGEEVTGLKATLTSGIIGAIIVLIIARLIV